MSIELAQKSLLGKARERPDLVKQVIQKVQSEGLTSTVHAVRARLDSTVALGYSAAGTVIEIGAGVNGFRVGDRVACAGAGYAAHAEAISVPQNLCVHLPAEVSFETGAFGTLGAIALQAVRLAQPTLGESVAVIGLGLLGQITCQLLKANGCRAFGIDLDPFKVESARELGVDALGINTRETVQGVLEWTRGRGADAVLIAAATMSSDPLRLAAEISRLKGRVVAVGLVGLDVPRHLFYERELTLVVSRSYGPGRYDPEFEERGHDYPFAYVRWTETRNIEAFLDLLASRKIDCLPLITHRFSIDEADKAYELITGQNQYLGVVLNYDTQRELKREISLDSGVKAQPGKADSVRLGVIGAGRYVRGMLLPKFKSMGAEFRSVTTASGVSASDAAKQFGFQRAVSGFEEIVHDKDVNLIVIGTRHELHAEMARRALEANINVFVEKPLALNDEELDSVLAAAQRSSAGLMVGFNRRFAPLAIAAKKFFADRNAPISMLYRVNAGRIERGHWIQDPVEGGGRIIGEVCHFIDLMQFLTGSLPETVFAESVSGRNEQIIDEDSVFITLRFADGSNGCIAYVSEGDTTLPKERLEIFGAGRSFVLDDFRAAVAYKDGRHRRMKLKRQDKGQTEEVRKACQMVLEGGVPAPISLAELAAVTRSTFCINESLRLRQPVRVDHQL